MSLWRHIMGTLNIRNLDDQVIERLKAQAKANHRSLEGEVRFLLTQQLDRLTQFAEFRDRTRQILSLTVDTQQTDSVELLREDRRR